jgi:hypothetical protein
LQDGEVIAPVVAPAPHAPSEWIVPKHATLPLHQAVAVLVAVVLVAMVAVPAVVAVVDVL